MCSSTKETTPGWLRGDQRLHLVQDAGFPRGCLCTGPKPCWTQITDGGGAVQGQQQLACSLAPGLPEGPSPWQAKVKRGFYPKAGGVPQALWWRRLFLWQPPSAGCAWRVTNGDLKGVIEAEATQGRERRPVLPQAARGTCPQLWGPPGKSDGVGGAAPESHPGFPGLTRGVDGGGESGHANFT